MSNDQNIYRCHQCLSKHIRFSLDFIEAKCTDCGWEAPAGKAHRDAKEKSTREGT